MQTQESVNMDLPETCRELRNIPLRMYFVKTAINVYPCYSYEDLHCKSVYSGLVLQFMVNIFGNSLVMFRSCDCPKEKERK
jgi:hypothetical protein